MVSYSKKQARSYILSVLLLTISWVILMSSHIRVVSSLTVVSFFSISENNFFFHSITYQRFCK